MGTSNDPFLRIECLLDEIEETLASRLRGVIREARAQVADERERQERLGRACADAAVNSVLMLEASPAEVRRLATAQAEAIVNASLVIDELETSLSAVRMELDQARLQRSQAEEKSQSLAVCQADAIVHSAALISELEETKLHLQESHNAEREARCAAERLSGFGEILDKSNNEIFIFRADSLRFLHANHGALQNLGYSLQEMQELTPLDLKKEFTAESFDSLVAPLRRGELGVIRFSSRHTRKDGTSYPVEINLQLSNFESTQAFVAIVMDITTRLQLEDQLRTSRQAAIAADRAKSDFLANMSHEIRTPMTAILGYTDLLLEEGDLERAPGPRIEALQTIRRSGDHLLSLINDILDLSKIEAGKLMVESIAMSPRQVIVDVLRTLRSRAELSEIELSLDGGEMLPEQIRSDPTRFRQILTNLIGNAIKFTNRGSVCVTVRFLAGPQPLLECDVTDSGEGMTAEQASRLFRPFTQADATTTRRFGGTGLGLTISRRLARLLQGDVVLVRTEPGAGTTFRVTVRADIVSDGSSPQLVESNRVVSSQPAVRTETLAGCSVLVVDDVPENRKFVKYCLTKAGATVDLASNGQEAVQAALAAAESRPYDVILMDMQMPVMDGYQATSHLRAVGYSRPVVALTASAMAEDREKCLAAGCDDFASKPIDRQDLIAKVLRLSERDSARLPEQKDHTCGVHSPRRPVPSV